MMIFFLAFIVILPLGGGNAAIGWGSAKRFNRHAVTIITALFWLELGVVFQFLVPHFTQVFLDTGAPTSSKDTLAYGISLVLVSPLLRHCNGKPIQEPMAFRGDRGADPIVVDPHGARHVRFGYSHLGF